MLLCQNCCGTNDVTEFTRGEEQHVLCVDCRVALLAPRNQGARMPGRPSMGVAKKVSITLPEETWGWFDAEADKLAGGRSSLLRYLINREQNPENNWSNSICLGYAIMGAQHLGFKETQIKQLVSAIRREFDESTFAEARVVYELSPY